MTGNELLTTGDLSELTGLERSTVHRKIYELDIEPVMVAGRTRLFAADTVELIRDYKGPKS